MILSITAVFLFQSLPMVDIQPVIGNPASIFCIQQGGRLEIRTLRDGGQIGICHLPNGRRIEEWKFFRQHLNKQPQSTKG